MKVTLYKVSFAGCWDSNINDNIRNILKTNGFVLNDSEETIQYAYGNGYPEGHDYNSWYKDNQYKEYTYQQYPFWMPEGKSEGLLVLNSEAYSELMFYNQTLEEKFEFSKVSKSTIVVDHPMESLFKDLSEMLTKGFGQSIVKSIIKTTKGG